MKEECEQRKEERKKAKKKEMQQCNRVNKSFEKIPRFDGSAPHYCFDWLEQTEALSIDIQIGTTKKNCCSTAAIVSPKQSMQYRKEPPTSKSRMQCYATTRTYALYLNDQMLTKTCTKNQMRLFKLTTPDTHHTSDLLTQNWTLMTHSRGCTAFTMHHYSMANSATR